MSVRINAAKIFIGNPDSDEKLDVTDLMGDFVIESMRVKRLLLLRISSDGTGRRPPPAKVGIEIELSGHRSVLAFRDLMKDSNFVFQGYVFTIKEISFDPNQVNCDVRAVYTPRQTIKSYMPRLQWSDAVSLATFEKAIKQYNSDYEAYQKQIVVNKGDLLFDVNNLFIGFSLGSQTLSPWNRDTPFEATMYFIRPDTDQAIQNITYVKLDWLKARAFAQDGRPMYEVVPIEEEFESEVKDERTTDVERNITLLEDDF